MKKRYCDYFIGVWVLIFAGILLSCSKPRTAVSAARVQIVFTDGKYQIFRNGKPFLVKGASGFENLDRLAKLGGNTIRVWDTTNLKQVLLDANKYKLAVIVGLDMLKSGHMDFYNDSTKTNNQYNSFKKLINEYKHDPAILMWCVGNELGFPADFNQRKFYQHFNRIVDMIHHDDPDHPVTTTTNKRAVLSILAFTNLDVVSFNMFASIHDLRKELKWFSFIWDGPFLLTEWGIDGPWEGTPQTAWGAYIEPSSSQKAAVYLERHQNAMPVDTKGYLGSMIFFWGHKQETTHTWFSMFAKDGSPTQSVGVANYIWSGKNTLGDFPQTSEMIVNGKKAADNIIEKVGSKIKASLNYHKQDSQIKHITWEFYPEDWHKEDGESGLKFLKPIASLTVSRANKAVYFTAPLKHGPYRIFATITNLNGNVATCNTPLYLVKK